MSNWSFNSKGAGLIAPGAVHYIDHLAVVCVIMEIPLLFLDEAEFDFARKYYPNLNAVYVNFEEFTPDFLISNFNVLYSSDLWNSSRFYPKFKKAAEEQGKALRFVFCPHGFSDKGFYFQQCIHEDIILVYGQNMLDLLEYVSNGKTPKNYVFTGNYRYTYYKQNKSFYDQIFGEKIGKKLDQSKPTILYAPTWQDADKSSSFYDADSILDQLPEDYNIIVKPHPRLELDDIAQYYRIEGKCEDKENAFLIKDFNIIYPLLNFSDIYVGDFSAVGYDFLSFNKPMFFINTFDKAERSRYLCQCGVEVKDPKQLYKIMEEELPQDATKFKAKREEVYAYTFGEEKSFTEIKNDINAMF